MAEPPASGPKVDSPSEGTKANELDLTLDAPPIGADSKEPLITAVPIPASVLRENTRTWMAAGMLAILAGIVIGSFVFLFWYLGDVCLPADQWGEPSVVRQGARATAISGGQADGGAFAPVAPLDGGTATVPPPSQQQVAVSGLNRTQPVICRPKTAHAVDDLVKVLTVLFGPIITLIGTVMGFYYGGAKEGR